MRSLKFRVWGLYGDEYTYIDEENQAEADSFWDRGCIAILDEKHIIEYGTDEDGNGDGYEYCDVKEVETIEQYTGLKDKNGKEIYEGDILQDESNDTAVVIWREYQAEWGIKWIHMGTEDSLSHRMEWGHLNEVIGNIHSNPELLEQEDGEIR